MKKTKKSNSLIWIADLLSEHPTFAKKPMFGCLAVYYNGSLVLVLADKDEPWSGILICTSKEYHAKLQKNIKGLKSHEVLGKWLYTSKESKNFETVVMKVVDLIKNKSEMIGV